MSILKRLKKYTDRPKKIIVIPTEKELYNIIINIYITKMIFNNALYLKSDFLYFCTDYIKSITLQLKNKLNKNIYNFTLETLTKYIDKAITGSQTLDKQSIFNISSFIDNLTYSDLMQESLKYFILKLDYNELMAHTPNKKIKQYIQEYISNYFLTHAANKPIDQIQNFLIFTSPP